MFSGGLTILPSEEGLVAINSVLTEDYLLSVISSEMNGDAPEEFLKAHAVISRSWLLARPTLGGGDNAGPAITDHTDRSDSSHGSEQPVNTESPATADRIIRWYDREDHTLFDVCADDHCQRYQGLLRARGYPRTGADRRAGRSHLRHPLLQMLRGSLRAVLCLLGRRGLRLSASRTGLCR